MEKWDRYSRLKNKLRASINKFLLQSLNIGAVMITKNFGRQHHQIDRLKRKLEKLVIAEHKQFMEGIPQWAAMTSVTGIMRAIILYMGGVMVGGGTIPVQTMVSFVFYLNRSMRPVKDLTSNLGILSSNINSIERIFNQMELFEKAFLNDQTKKSLKNVEGEIEFKNVSFSYHPEETNGKILWAVKDLNFKIHPGEKVRLQWTFSFSLILFFRLLSLDYQVLER